MRVEYLKYFVDVAELGSIAAAAKANFMSAQGMSRSILALEKDLDCRLFDRAGKRLVLSKYGERILPEAQAVVQAERRIRTHVSETRANAEHSALRSVRLYLNSIAFESGLFGPLLDGMERVFENARYIQCSNAEVIERLLADKPGSDFMSMGLLCLFDVNEDENAEILERLREEGYSYQPYIESYDEVVVAASSELAQRCVLSHDEICSRQIITPPGDICAAVGKVFGADAISAITADNTFRFRAVAHGVAISFVPAFSKLFPYTSEDVKIIPMRDPYHLQIGIAARKGILDNEYVRSLFAVLNENYAEYSDSPYLSFASSAFTRLRPNANDKIQAIDAVDSLDFTPREKEVALQLVSGATTREIAAHFAITVPTVKTHIANVYRKAGVHSKDELFEKLR